MSQSSQLLLDWLDLEIKKLRLDVGLLSDRGKVYKETLETVQKKLSHFHDQEQKSGYTKKK